jgi:phosphomannomutase
MLSASLPIEVLELNAESGSFAHGAPDPTLPEARAQMREAILEHHADFGVAWDGDADRCCFFDAQGMMIANCYIGALLAERAFQGNPSALIVHDVRVVLHLSHLARRYPSGCFLESKSGHTNMKHMMQGSGAAYGYENSGHHYFDLLGGCDSGMLPLLKVLGCVYDAGTLDKAVALYRAGHSCIEELNLKNQDYQVVKGMFMDAFKDAIMDENDGLSMRYPDWRCNIRASNTEPLVRLNVEAISPAVLDMAVDRLMGVMDGALLIGR